jgi:hypothetical protein
MRKTIRQTNSSSSTDSVASSEDEEWLNMPAVGREFGSPDFERLATLDDAAFAVFKSWQAVRVWLATPHPGLDGMCPEVASALPDGQKRVIALLATEDPGKEVG